MKPFLFLIAVLFTTLSFSQTPEEQAQAAEISAIIATQNYSDADYDKVKDYFKQPDFKVVYDEMLAEGMEEAVFAQEILAKSYNDAVAEHGKQEIDGFIYGFLQIIETELKFKALNAQLDANLAAIDNYDDAAVPFLLEHVSLNVKDVNASAQFYADIFGLSEIFNRGEVAGIRWFSLGKGRELHLISTVKGDVSLNRAAHFAVTALDFEGFVMRIKNAKIPHQDWAGIPNTVSLRPDGVKQVYIQDPDGNWIEINSPRPKD